tara:strand:+ start:103 stop:291 length:189 start_codon:yes stop_codon:yes gene_type:complete
MNLWIVLVLVVGITFWIGYWMGQNDIIGNLRRFMKNDKKNGKLSQSDDSDGNSEESSERGEI